MVSPKRAMINNCTFRKSPVTATLQRLYAELEATFMREVARSRNLLSGFLTTLKRLFESVVGTLFCLLLYVAILFSGTHVHMYCSYYHGFATDC